MDVTSRSRPINIELTGTPEAGKTTQMARLSKLLTQDGFIVRTIRESAEIVPTCFKKRSIEANRWMRLKTSADVLCANSEDVDIILIDRGLVDGIIWQEIFLEEGKLSLIETETYAMWTRELNLQPDLLLAFFLDPKISIERRGGEGRITTTAFVAHYNSVVRKYLDTYQGKYLAIDASLPFDEVTHVLMDSILSLVP